MNDEAYFEDLAAVTESAAADPEQSSHSWLPVDLVARGLEPPAPPTIAGIVYPGRRHVLSGEPEALKTWLALAICVEEIRAGRTVAYVDLEMGERAMLERLRALGLSDEEIGAGFVYLAPDEPLGDASVIADIESLLSTERPSLVVVDAFTGALALHGFDPNSGVEVERFYRSVVARLQASGAAVLLLDHLAKAKDARGRFSIGSERKLGGADVHLGCELVRPFGRGRSGLAKLATHKDRPGHLARPSAAEFALRSDPETHAVTYTIEPSADALDGDDEEGGFRPTVLMERVSRELERHGGEARSRNDLVQDVQGRGQWVRRAIDVLAAEGNVLEEDGPRGAKLVRLVRPFRDDDQDADVVGGGGE